MSENRSKWVDTHGLCPYNSGVMDKVAGDVDDVCFTEFKA